MLCRISIIVILCTLLHKTHILVSQQPTFIFESMDDKISLTDPFDIIEDQQGYLWIATLDGLYRFDGKEFEKYRQSSSHDGALSSNRIISLLENNQGQLLIGFSDGSIDISDIGKRKFKPLIKFQGIGRGKVNSMIQDDHQNYWLGTDQGLFIVKLVRDTLFDITRTFIQDEGTFITNDLRVRTLLLDEEKNIWIGAKEGLFLYRSNKSSVKGPFEIENETIYNIRDIAMDREKRIWIGSSEGQIKIYRYSQDNNRFHPIGKSIFESNISRIKLAFDLEGRLWVSEFGHGFYGINTTDNTVFFSSKKNSNIQHLSFVRDPFVDRNGNIWLLSDGLFKYSYNRGFLNYTHPFQYAQSNSAIFLDQDNLWAAYREFGLLKINKQTNETIIYSTAKKANPKFAGPIFSIYPIDNSKLLITGFGKVYELNTDTHVIRDEELIGSIRAINKDMDDQLWISNVSGIHKYIPGKGIDLNYNLSSRIGYSPFCQGVINDMDNNLWIATEVAGLIKFDLDQETFEQYTNDASSKIKLPSMRINDICFCGEKELWAGTDAGLSRINLEDYTTQTYTVHDGLKNDFIASVVCNSENQIWVSTNDGIAATKIDKVRFEYFNKEDGLLNSFYYPRTKYHDDSGFIYFGGRYGIDFFHPDSIRKKIANPTILLESIELSSGNTLFPETLKRTDQIKISYQEDYLKFNIVGMNFPTPNLVQYAYRIPDISNDWIDVAENSEIIISKLNPNDYTIDIKGIDVFDPEISALHSLSFSIQPPFWQTSIFKFVSVFLASICLFGLIRYRENLIRKKESEKLILQQKMMELEKKALMSQMNPHFIFNAMNSIQEYIISEDTEEALTFLRKFSRLVRQVLNYSNQKKIPLYEEIELVEDYMELELIRFPNKFQYSISVDKNVDIHTLEIPPFLIQPQIENSIKHGFPHSDSKGILNIHIGKARGYLNINIKDNGIGREASKKRKGHSLEHQSMGISITSQRLELMNSPNQKSQFSIQDILSPDGEVAGTQVNISIPIDLL